MSGPSARGSHVGGRATAALVREVFEPLRGRAMPDEEVNEAAENVRRFYEILYGWARADQRRAAAAGGRVPLPEPQAPVPDPPPKRKRSEGGRRPKRRA